VNAQPPKIILTPPVIEILRARLFPALAVPADFQGKLSFTLHVRAGALGKIMAEVAEFEDIR
jgi:hypothetical protein